MEFIGSIIKFIICGALVVITLQLFIPYTIFDLVVGTIVNIFGGIMKCDTIATGVVTACKAVNLSVPLVVRMKGTNEELGKQILRDSGLPIIAADTMAEAAEKIVAAVK